MSGVTLDGYGGLHPFGTLTSVQQTAYWPGWDIARAVRLSSSSTVTSPSGWLLDGYGGLHPFGGTTAVSGPYFGFDAAVQLVTH